MVPFSPNVALENRGWASSTFGFSAEAALREDLFRLAAKFGTPVATRTGGGACDTLIPIQGDEAKPKSLSKLHSDREFPLHVDTAHWLTPCRYIILACVYPGGGDRPTFVLDAHSLSLSKQQTCLLRTTPFRVTNGRKSFYSTILSKGRPFVRLDPGCLTATSPDGAEVLALLSRNTWPNEIEAIRWERGKVLVIDNLRVLHVRGRSDRADSDRKLLRISIR
jgi:alpha-ketoglutarate-dependent taurine dioxygenase